MRMSDSFIATTWSLSPVPATEESRGILEQHLRELFKGSTFNICTHQPLPMMAGPPLRLNIDPKAKPITAHKAAAVPVHWEEKVKAHLDRDVRLGVLEKVPIGTPDTWCHRMVIVGKANGERSRNPRDAPHKASLPSSLQCTQDDEEVRV